MALWAVKVAKSRGVDHQFTYGWQRAEILGALVNGVFLVALCLSIFLEAIQRFVEPQVVTNPKLILVVGCLGLTSNLVGLVLFHEHGHSHGHSHSPSLEDEEHGHGHGHSHNHNDAATLTGEQTPLLTAPSVQYVNDSLAEGSSDTNTEDSEHANHFHSQPKIKAGKTKSLNMEGVFLHVLGDALGNIGVIATALFIWLTDYEWRFYMDPVISLVITVIIFSSALPLCKRAGSILLQGAPASINAEQAKQDILSLNGVVEIHDFHIWILKEDMYIATLHVSVCVDEDEFMNLIPKVQKCLREHGVHSITVQPEFLSHDQHSATNSERPLSRQSSFNKQCLLQGNTSSGGLAS